MQRVWVYSRGILRRENNVRLYNQNQNQNQSNSQKRALANQTSTGHSCSVLPNTNEAGATLPRQAATAAPKAALLLPTTGQSQSRGRRVRGGGSAGAGEASQNTRGLLHAPCSARVISGRGGAACQSDPSSRNALR
jgi:outer membrane PBP1 activator LpoA protein